MSEVARLAPDMDNEVWQYGDVVLDANGRVWSRASPGDVARGWPWSYGVMDGDPYAAEDSVEEGTPARPLTLLVRSGQAVNTIVVSPAETQSASEDQSD
ncbi:hypothetical protein GZH49_17140 [Nocardia terpenica]|uniref:hypothetical protein n=1 Tax=Nocardia terpenica TaxID=455432 RepID=UPI002FE1A721